MNQIICPSCKKPVEISEALRHQFEESLRLEFQESYTKDLEKMKKELEEKAEKRLKEEMELKLKDTQSAAESEREKNKKLQHDLLELMQQLRDLKEKDSQREVEMQRTLMKEREKIQEDISKVEKEKANLEKMELQKQLDDTKKALEEAQRKAAQKSQQLQGEVLELDLEEQLREAFPSDEILPVPKGVEGGDIWQKVRNRHGQLAGSILWETKRTKAWSNSWTAKLRENTRQAGASVSILVSDVLPEGVEKFGMHENVWVTCYEYALALANVLRVGLMQVAIAKSAAANKDAKLEALYAYLTDDTFRHRFEAQVESIIELKNDLESEQRSMVRLWKKREMQINRMRNNLSGMYGELQGVVGEALPTISSLDSSQLLEGSLDKQSKMTVIDADSQASLLD